MCARVCVCVFKRIHLKFIALKAINELMGRNSRRIFLPFISTELLPFFAASIIENLKSLQSQRLSTHKSVDSLGISKIQKT